MLCVHIITKGLFYRACIQIWYVYTIKYTCFLHDRPWTRTLDASLGDVPLYYIGKHVKQTLVDTYHHKFSHGFRKKKTRPFRRSSMSMFKRWDIGKMFHQFDEWGLWSRGNRKSFQLGFVRQNLSSSVDTSKLQALVPVFWSQMSDCVVLAVDYETAMYQVMNKWNRKIFLVIDGERQKLRHISISGCMRVCSYLWKFSCSHSHCYRRTWCLAFWALWRFACCSQKHCYGTGTDCGVTLSTRAFKSKTSTRCLP